MDMCLERDSFESDGIFSHFTSVDGKNIFITLEHAFLQPDGTYAPIIPAGNYTCQRRLSPRFGFDVFQIMNVPGHTFCEIHIGNFNKDSDGCVLVGLAKATAIGGGNQITNSKIAFQKFMDLQSGVNSFNLTVQ